MIQLVIALGRNVEFVFNCFSQDENIRTYIFQGIADDRKTRTEFSVEVDLTLLHKHGIPLQEVPPLCCRLLASDAEVGLFEPNIHRRRYACSRGAPREGASRGQDETQATGFRRDGRYRVIARFSGVGVRRSK